MAVAHINNRLFPLTRKMPPKPEDTKAPANGKKEKEKKDAAKKKEVAPPPPPPTPLEGEFQKMACDGDNPPTLCKSLQRHFAE